MTVMTDRQMPSYPLSDAELRAAMQRGRQLRSQALFAWLRRVRGDDAGTRAEERVRTARSVS